MKTNVLVFSLFLICFYGCYDVKLNYRLSIKNRSDKKISILYLNDMNMHNENNVDYYLNDYVIAKPDSSVDITKVGNANAWHEFIDEGRSKKLYLYAFDVDTLKYYKGQYSMDDLVSAHKYLKVLTYSENELNKINWKVTFDK